MPRKPKAVYHRDTLGDALRTAMEQRGVSQYKLADAIGVQQGAVNKWCDSSREPSFATVAAICAFLDCSFLFTSTNVVLTLH